MPFKVDTIKLRSAFDWLIKHNGYYKAIVWNDNAKDEWDDNPQLPCREEPIEEHQELSQGVFEAWLELANDQESFGMASRMHTILVQNGIQEVDSYWFAYLGILADVRQKPALRISDTTSTSDLAYVFYMQECEGKVQQDALSFNVFKQLPYEQWHDFTRGIVLEICTVKFQVVDSEMVVHVASTEDAPADTDDADRMEVIDELLAAAAAVDKKNLPRIDAPMVDDAPHQAVREDTPGYIACAFPSLFPFGTGDYHSSRGQAHGKFDFGTWGKHVLQYHDQRFMRHLRFRYFFLNTWLRMKTPGVRSVFWKIHSELGDLKLEHLQDSALRKKVIQQMTTATANIPGSLGEKRYMRQCLEALVDQKEQETADLNENAGRGRLPAGFCTLTCAVYRWSALHDVILKAYSPEERQEYLKWRYVEDEEEKECLKRDIYYKLAQKNPGVVAWFCALRLEVLVHLTVQLVSHSLQHDTVPGRSEDWFYMVSFCIWFRFVLFF